MNEDDQLTAEALLQSGWRAVRPAGEDQGYATMQFAFLQASKAAEAAGRLLESRALALFVAVTSMMLRPESPNAPFGPSIEIGNRRSAVPEDFSASKLQALAEASGRIDDPWLRARFADIAWLCIRPRDIAMARRAIDAYVEIPLTQDDWQYGAVHCWARAIALCRQLGRAETDRLNRIEALLLEGVRTAAPDSGFYLRKIAGLLSEGRLASKHAAEVASRLHLFADEGLSRGDFRLARHYFESAAQWHDRAKEENPQADCLVGAAETYVREAEARLATDPNAHLVAASFYEDAIQAYRRVPKAKRLTRRVDERSAEIYRMYRLASELATGQMISVTSKKIDISELVHASRAAVQGKALGDAIDAFAAVHFDPGREKHFKNAAEFFKANPIQAMIQESRLNNEGRVVGVRPGVSLQDPDASENDVALRAQAIRSYVVDTRFVVQSRIAPALEVILREHRFSLADVIDLAAQSPIVPPHRAQLVGKALYFGFERDFETALHLAAPQIEHFVRWHLQQNNVKTTNIDREGIETELGLSTLVGMAEMNDVFGENLTFELTALFCDAFGPNLRNEIAHGLLDSGQANSDEAIYAWWLLLKLVFSAFVTQKIRESASAAMPPQA